MSTSRPAILFILHAYTNKGGTEEHTKLLAEGLQSDFEIFIAAPDRGLIRLYQNEQIIAEYQSPAVPWPVTPFEWESAEIALEKIIARVKPAVLHVQHLLNWPLGILSKIRSFGIPALLSYHDYYMLSPYFTLQGNAERATHSPIASKEIFGADITLYLQSRRKYFGEMLKDFVHHITPSRFVAELLASVFPLPFITIEHGIPPFKAPPRRVDDGTVRFGYVGSLLPQKGWRRLIEAFQELNAEHSEAELHLYGSGDGVDEEVLRQSSLIHFHGRYDRSDLPRICGEIDVAIIPSEFLESYCLVLSEMWQGGVPVAVSDIGALGARVHDGVDGKKFIAGDPQSIKATLRWFLERSEWRSWNLPTPRLLTEMVSEYQDVYRTILKS